MPDACTDVRAIAPEVALGVASAEERARVLGHVATCPECRARLVELSTIVDDLIMTVPEAEPPSGFESAVLARLEERRDEPGRQRWSSALRVLRAAVLLLLVSGASAGAVYLEGRSDRELAAALRRTLAIADGEYFVAFELVEEDGEQRGAVFAYQGHPPWILLTFRDEPPSGPLAVEVIGRDGTTHRLTDDFDPSTTAAWAAAIPIAVHDATLLQLVGPDGRLVLSASLIIG